MAFSVCVIWLSSCPEGWVQASQKAKCVGVGVKVNVLLWGQRKVCVCAPVGWAKKYTGQRKVLWFTGTSRMWKNRINNAPLRSSNTHTHAFSSPFSTAMARGTSTLVHMPILVCTHHYVCTNTSFSLWKTNHPKQKLMRCTNLSSSIILCKVLHITEGCHLFLLLKCHLFLPQSFSCSF